MIQREFNKPLVVTKKHFDDFKKSYISSICEKPFKEGDVKVTHHHINGNIEMPRIKIYT